MSHKVFTNLEAALDYFGLKDIDADLAVIPPNVDERTNEDELNDENFATSLVGKVTCLVKVINADGEDGSDVPCTSIDQNPQAKQQ